jgi:hypothetical protein
MLKKLGLNPNVAFLEEEALLLNWQNHTTEPRIAGCVPAIVKGGRMFWFASVFTESLAQATKRAAFRYWVF